METHKTVTWALALNVVNVPQADNTNMYSSHLVYQNCFNKQMFNFALVSDLFKYQNFLKILICASFTNIKLQTTTTFLETVHMGEKATASDSQRAVVRRESFITTPSSI